jgi:hypothetical protein
MKRQHMSDVMQALAKSQMDILKMMWSDSFRRFCHTPLYEQFLNSKETTSQNQGVNNIFNIKI